MPVPNSNRPVSAHSTNPLPAPKEREKCLADRCAEVTRQLARQAVVDNSGFHASEGRCFFVSVIRNNPLPLLQKLFNFKR